MKNWSVLFSTRLGQLYRKLRVFVLQPRLALDLLSRQSVVARGINYSKNWKNYASEPIVSSSYDLAPSSGVISLKSYFDNHKEGKGIWKWNHYFDIYQQHFKKFVGREVHVLEIGVYSGGSLEMWRDFFGPGCHVYGVDVEEACRAYENGYTKIFIGDQADCRFWKVFKDKVPRIDILIDDGAHQTEQQIVALEEMLPYLSLGGIYACEDIQGTHNKFSSYLHGLVKGFNVCEAGCQDKPTQFQSWIKSINLYPYLAVIEKAEKPKENFFCPKHGTEWQPFV